MAHMMLNAILRMASDDVPRIVRQSLHSAFHYLFSPKWVTIVVEEHPYHGARNDVFDAAMVYLPTKIRSDTRRFNISRTPKQRSLSIGIETDVELVDLFDGNVVLKWKLGSVKLRNRSENLNKRFFELSFNKKYRDRVLDEDNGYLEFVMKMSKEMVNNTEKVVNIYGGNGANDKGGGSINLDHPFTFDKLAMDPELKKTIIDDLDRFVRGKEFYRKVGKAWKRGYLLYGPPGTGKSSLIAAMANYLKYDIYDLELTSLYSNKDLRKILLSTSNRTIIVIEDIDCNVEMQVRQRGIEQEYDPRLKLTLSGLLNFIDGLWSSCGDERIIIFTTNYRDRLDPALLRPGRMDMEIHMSYCTGQGFRFLAFNYLNIHDDHGLFGEIEDLIANVEVTPAEVAEQLMRSEDVDIALTGVVKFLKRKMEANEIEEDKANGPEVRESKRLKIEEDKADGPEVHEPETLKIL